MNIVTGAPCSGKTTLCQYIVAVELPVHAALHMARELDLEGTDYTVIFLFCHKDILINRAINRYEKGALKHVAEILEYHEPMMPQLRQWFKDFLVLHTDAGIDQSFIGALNASRNRRIEVSAIGTQASRVLQGCS